MIPEHTHFSIGTLVHHDYYGGRIEIGIIVGMVDDPSLYDPVEITRKYIVFIENDFDRWGEWFLRDRIVSVASPQVKCP